VEGLTRWVTRQEQGTFQPQQSEAYGRANTRSQTGRVSRQGQPVTSFRTGSVSPPFRFSEASITSIAWSQTRRDFLRRAPTSRPLVLML
jgi:hypothetical protein